MRSLLEVMQRVKAEGCPCSSMLAKDKRPFASSRLPRTFHSSASKLFSSYLVMTPFTSRGWPAIGRPDWPICANGE